MIPAFPVAAVQRSHTMRPETTETRGLPVPGARGRSQGVLGHASSCLQGPPPRLLQLWWWRHPGDRGRGCGCITPVSAPWAHGALLCVRVQTSLFFEDISHPMASSSLMPSAKTCFRITTPAGTGDVNESLGRTRVSHRGRTPRKALPPRPQAVPLAHTLSAPGPVGGGGAPSLLP